MKIPLPISIILLLVQAYLFMHYVRHPMAAVVIGCIAGWTIRGQYDACRLKKLGIGGH